MIGESENPYASPSSMPPDRYGLSWQDWFDNFVGVCLFCYVLACLVVILVAFVSGAIYCMWLAESVGGTFSKGTVLFAMLVAAFFIGRADGKANK